MTIRTVVLASAACCFVVTLALVAAFNASWAHGRVDDLEERVRALEARRPREQAGEGNSITIHHQSSGQMGEEDE